MKRRDRIQRPTADRPSYQTARSDDRGRTLDADGQLLDRVGFAGTHDPDEMVGKLRMHLGHVVLGHVAGRAIGRGFGTGRSGRLGSIGRLAALRTVAAQAALIIKTSLLNQRLVRIMTREADQPLVPANSPTPAFFKAIGRETHVARHE